MAFLRIGGGPPPLTLPSRGRRPALLSLPPEGRVGVGSRLAVAGAV